MLQKKVCMLGGFAVGKTSLVARHVQGVFDESYHTTIGVKIDRKMVEHEGQPVRLQVWDLHGEDDFQTVRTSYLKGSHGFVLVVDGTRRETLDVALELKERAEEAVGEVPFVMMLNKGDLTSEWALTPADVEGDRDPGCLVLRTSAKTGEGVEDAFAVLVRGMVRG